MLNCLETVLRVARRLAEDCPVNAVDVCLVARGIDSEDNPWDCIEREIWSMHRQEPYTFESLKKELHVEDDLNLDQTIEHITQQMLMWVCEMHAERLISIGHPLPAQLYVRSA